MEKLESSRIKRLQELGHMNQELVRGADLAEEATDTPLPRELPLMLFIVMGASLTMATWIVILYFTVGTDTVTTTLGTHFLR